jgi:hypothetical protein
MLYYLSHTHTHTLTHSLTHTYTHAYTHACLYACAFNASTIRCTHATHTHSLSHTHTNTPMFPCTEQFQNNFWQFVNVGTRDKRYTSMRCTSILRYRILFLFHFTPENTVTP